MFMTSINKKNPESKRNLSDLLRLKSVKTIMVFITVMLTILSGTALTGIAVSLTTNALENAADDFLIGAGESNSMKMLIFMYAAEDITRILATDAIVHSSLNHWNDGSFTPEEQIRASEYFAASIDVTSPIFKAIHVLDTNGVVVASSTEKYNNQDFSRFLPTNNQIKTANPHISEPITDSEGDPALGVTIPVYDANGTHIGFSAIWIHLKALHEIVLSTPGLSEDSESFIVDPDGMILSSVNGDYSSFLKKKYDMSIFAHGERVVDGLGYKGYESHITKTAIPGINWSIITIETMEAMDGPIMKLVWIMVGSLLLSILISGVLTFFASNAFVRPVQILTNNAKHLAAGDVDIDISFTSSTELGQLADSFRDIVKNMKRNAEYVRNIAAGNVSDELVITSDKDIEGKALIQMRDTLSAMVMSLDTLAHRSSEGDLSYRADANQFQGVYHDLLQTMNHVFDLIITPIQETMRLSTSYSSGDYSDRFDPDLVVQGDFVSFKNALNQIGIQTSATLLRIRSGVNDISAGTLESSGSIEDIARSVATLAESASKVDSLTDQNDIGLEQSLTAMNDLTNTVGEIAQRTSSVSLLAGQASDLSYDGVKRAELAGDGMKEIMESFELTSKSVSSMSELMVEIGGIVDVISSIAEQTSLLALNAAIEAARAGDAGLGFAVVADEVKSLAQESQTSAEHIGSIIGQLQKMSMEMTTGMQKATGVMQSGNNAVTETVTIFHQMSEAISDVTKNISEVATASEEQAASVEEITASMSEVRNLVKKTAKEATESAVAAEKISSALDPIKHSISESVRLAEAIEEQVNVFKIE